MFVKPDCVVLERNLCNCYFLSGWKFMMYITTTGCWLKCIFLLISLQFVSTYNRDCSSSGHQTIIKLHPREGHICARCSCEFSQNASSCNVCKESGKVIMIDKRNRINTYI